MCKTANGTRRLLLLFSDTGGGHRSTAYAVAQTLCDLYGERAQVEMVDALAEYAPWPFNRPSDVYPQMLRLKGLVWRAGFRLSDGPRRVKLPAAGWELLTNAAMRRLLRDHPADLVVSCHAAFNHLLLRLLPKVDGKTPLVTLVTDLTAAHAFWFAPGVARCLVPTEGTRQEALIRGLSAERVLETGLPVRSCFAQVMREDATAVRRRLGLRTELPVVLIVSGAEGMGSPYRLYKAIANSGVRAQLVVIAGRNRRLHDKLAAEEWPLPVRVEGFVRNMHEWMRSADLLVTRASPTVITEATVVGLPMVLSGALPGHERPNVDYVTQSGAGLWAPKPGQAAAAVRELLPPGNPRLAQMAARARALARPDAARHVADILWSIAGGELA
jgi:1,2-diacylglycerol 3-beta-galactosyltransferase